MFEYDGESSFDMLVQSHHLPPLHHLFNFNNDELIANQQGHITQSQLQKLDQNWLKPIGIGLAFVLLINHQEGLFIGIIFAMVVFVIYDQSNIKHQTLCSVSGIAHKRWMGNSFEISVNDVTFTLNSRQYDAIIESEAYTIYYALLPYTILSIEYADAAKK